ncbi:hypothetical protein [Massilia sp. Leaf139]|uniref:hypothetical protein n=1 Tax=Massilia sp. Leaf139 TaxID=1736272 RepID=UPI0006F64A95|nr:hypothetical protein [Massilia sp. Leaf139]KQQ91928.1 hypothetical protein ASF77_08360 [Massilia sp. Leaf139]
MRFLIVSLALVLTAGGLYAAVYGGNALLDLFSALSDSEQRFVSGGLAAFSALVLALGGWLRSRKAAAEE